MARHGLMAIVRAHDGRAPATRITELLCEEYDICDPGDLPHFVYAATTNVDDIARYGKLVMDAAALGDDVARRIVEIAGSELAKCTLAVARRLRITDEAFPVAYVGGAFHAGDVLLDPLRRAVLAAAPGATLGPPQHTPVEGAAMMAIQAASQPRPSRAP
jgi:N-acetylglucosamine kinase-like BadF-type ATPase